MYPGRQSEGLSISPEGLPNAGSPCLSVWAAVIKMAIIDARTDGRGRFGCTPRIRDEARKWLADEGWKQILLSGGIPERALRKEIQKLCPWLAAEQANQSTGTA